MGPMRKLSFLACVRTACAAALKDAEAHQHLSVCASEVAQCIEELLQEEPVERLDMELRQQAMSAIAAMSSAWLLSEKQKNGLLHACLSSVLHLPGYEDDMDPDMATYTEPPAAPHRPTCQDGGHGLAAQSGLREGREESSPGGDQGPVEVDDEDIEIVVV
ncbi:hypothetical protein CIB84_015592 [Bambusicola thoracicus]|uniref:MROH2B-like HEAT-repeats domain-containing protein n=1 Tax=Bambusicola thoracicus TaxID=9083 RepID=A0A2P4S972_BAMTH|nr:hypothetical protein CIB84_015592 [Bambusicola thoracicus]